MKDSASSAVTVRKLTICLLILLGSSVLAAAQHERVIHVFGTTVGDGVYPLGGLVTDASGNLYGTSQQGGICCGMVFELSPASPANWTETILYTFTDETDGGFPYGSLAIDSQGNLYGTTNAGGNPNCFTGCGTVFELSPPTLPGGSWTETTLYSFEGGSDGGNSYAGLLLDQSGTLYGTTSTGGGVGACGGPASGCGTVFELSPPMAPGGEWTETVLYTFTGGNDGAVPLAPVTMDERGNLYGTTHVGGSRACQFANCGTIFQLSHSAGGVWTEGVLHNFGNSLKDGYSPSGASLLLDKSGALVGTTPGGGSLGLGTVFGLLPPSNLGGEWSYGVLYSFGTSPQDGLTPQAGVILVDGLLYGTTSGGGANNLGTVYQLARTKGLGWKETGLFSFNGLDGAQPAAGLLLHDSALFGTTGAGGSEANAGTVFKIGP